MLQLKINSPAEVIEGKVYVITLTVTNQSTKAGMPVEAVLGIGISAATEFTTLISPQLSSEYFSANETRVFEYAMSVPIGAGGQGGVITSWVEDPTGLAIASATEDLVIAELVIPSDCFGFELRNPPANAIYWRACVEANGFYCSGHLNPSEVAIIKVPTYELEWIVRYAFQIFDANDNLIETRNKYDGRGLVRASLYYYDWASNVLGTIYVSLADLHGAVTDATTGNPMADVKVTFDSLVTYTSTDGRYEFKEVSQGQYRVVFTKSGYTTVSETVNLIAGDNEFNTEMVVPPPPPSITVTAIKVAPLREVKTTYRWKCYICGYIYEDTKPPQRCPFCLAYNTFQFVSGHTYIYCDWCDVTYEVKGKNLGSLYMCVVRDHDFILGSTYGSGSIGVHKVRIPTSGGTWDGKHGYIYIEYDGKIAGREW